MAMPYILVMYVILCILSYDFNTLPILHIDVHIWGTGMIASSSTFRPHPGRVIRDLLRLLNAVYGIVQKH